MQNMVNVWLWVGNPFSFLLVVDVVFELVLLLLGSCDCPVEFSLLLIDLESVAVVGSVHPNWLVAACGGIGFIVQLDLGLS